MRPSLAEESVPGVAIDWVFVSPTVRISRYRCRAEATAATGDQSQPWHVIAFPHGRPFVHHAADGDHLIDATRTLFLNAGTPYQTSHPFGCGDSGSALVLREDVLLDVVGARDPEVWSRPERPFPRSTAVSAASPYLGQRLLVRRLEDQSGLDPLAVAEEALALAAEAVAGLDEGLRRAPAPRRPERWLADVQRLLVENYDRSLGLEEVAAAAGVSVFHLCRTFRARTGLTLHRYRTQLRLRTALSRLARPVDLTELALDLGFASHSHFTAAFRAEFGVPPSHVRGRTAV